MEITGLYNVHRSSYSSYAQEKINNSSECGNDFTQLHVCGL